MENPNIIYPIIYLTLVVSIIGFAAFMLLKAKKHSKK